MPEPRTPHPNDDERLEAELLLFVDGALDAERSVGHRGASGRARGRSHAASR